MRERYLVLERSVHADKALALKPLYGPQIERFLEFVRSLD
jgi:hypothetical protein